MLRQVDVGTRILLCSAFSTTAGWINRFAVPLTIYGITGSAIDTSLAFAAAHLPAVTVGLFSGGVVDRYPAATLVKMTTISSAACIAAVAALLGTPGLHIAIYPLLFANSSLSAIQQPAFQVMLVEFCPKNELLALNAKLGMIDQTNSVLAPLISGLLVQLVRPSVLFVASALAYFAAAAAIFTVQSERNRHGADVTTLGGIKTGFQTILGDRQILAGTIVFLFSNFATTLTQSTSVPILARRFDSGAYAIGVFFAALGAFGIAGHALAKSIPARFNPAMVIVALTAISGILTALMTVDLPFAAFVALWGMTVTLGCINVTIFSTYRQRAVPSSLLGRSVSASRVATYFPIPLAAVLAGLIFERLGGNDLLAMSAIARLAGAFVALSAITTFKVASRT